jgi:type IV secretion system protein VirD4
MATLIMFGAHEEELMCWAAIWAGKTTRTHQSYYHNLDDKTTARQFGNALEPEELSPRNIGQARLLMRGTPGQTVERIEWARFRALPRRAACGPTKPLARRVCPHSEANGDGGGVLR